MVGVKFLELSELSGDVRGIHAAAVLKHGQVGQEQLQVWTSNTAPSLLHLQCRGIITPASAMPVVHSPLAAGGRWSFLMQSRESQHAEAAADIEEFSARVDALLAALERTGWVSSRCCPRCANRVTRLDPAAARRCLQGQRHGGQRGRERGVRSVPGPALRMQQLTTGIGRPWWVILHG